MSRECRCTPGDEIVAPNFKCLLHGCLCTRLWACPACPFHGRATNYSKDPKMRPSRAGSYIVREGTDKKLGRYYMTYVENGTRYFKWVPLQALAQPYSYPEALSIARDKGGRPVLLRAAK